MILQMLPGPISQAAENFAQMFLAQQRLEQEERAQELRERQQDLREQAFEQEMAEVQAQTMMNQAQLQANPQLQQNPAVGNVLSQIANAQSPAGATQALGPAINQAVITQATEAARAPTGEDVEAPSAGQFEQAAQATGVPGATRSAVRRATSPTEMEAMEDQLAAIQAVPAIRLGEAINQGEITLEEAAASNDPQMLMAAGQLGFDQELRAMREDFRQDLASERDFRESIQKSAVDQAESLLDETNMEGEIPTGLAVKFIRQGPESMTEDQMTRIAPLREQLRLARLKQQSAVISEVENTPTQALLSTAAEKALDDDNMESFRRLYEQKRQHAERMTGLRGENLPYPQLQEEVQPNFAQRIMSAITPGFAEGDRLEGLSRTLFGPAEELQTEGDIEGLQIQGTVSVEAAEEASTFVAQDHNGDIDAALRAMRRRISEAGGIEQVPERARQVFNVVRAMRDSLRRQNGNSE